MSTCLFPVLITNSNTLLATTRDMPLGGGIFNFWKTTVPNILKILVAFSGYFSVTVMRQSSCWESLALRSFFWRESTRVGKRPACAIRANTSQSIRGGSTTSQLGTLCTAYRTLKDFSLAFFNGSK